MANLTTIPELIKALTKFRASDLHLKPGRPPLFRVNGRIIAAKSDSIKPDQVRAAIESMLDSTQVEQLNAQRFLDFSFSVSGYGRFRCNAFFQRGHMSAVVRSIPIQVPMPEELGVPKSFVELSGRPRGLLLVTGSTGSGKSTTLASIVNHINRTRAVHVLTIEDPIEFLHRDDKATVSQREVGSDTRNFEEGLFSGLRQDPDIIVIGELRSAKVIEIALTAAESGHLVLSTLHTNDTKTSIERIIEAFPPDAHRNVRYQLASSLLGVLCQQLLPKSTGEGVLLVTEVMIKSPTIESLILKNELESIPDAIHKSTDYYGMHTFNQDLLRLIKTGLVDESEAIRASNSPEDLKLRLEGIERSDILHKVA